MAVFKRFGEAPGKWCVGAVRSSSRMVASVWVSCGYSTMPCRRLSRFSGVQFLQGRELEAGTVPSCWCGLMFVLIVLGDGPASLLVMDKFIFFITNGRSKGQRVLWSSGWGHVEV
jgi:hypothetical protein